MSSEKKIYELHREHQEWLNKLSFYKDDLAVMEKRILEIAAKNTSKEVLAMVDHYENQFLIQNTHIQNLKHSIKGNENLIMVSVRQNSVAADHRTIPDDIDNREKMQRFEEIFADLRKELIEFIAKTL